MPAPPHPALRATYLRPKSRAARRLASEMPLRRRSPAGGRRCCPRGMLPLGQQQPCKRCPQTGRRPARGNGPLLAMLFFLLLRKNNVPNRLCKDFCKRKNFTSKSREAKPPAFAFPRWGKVAGALRQTDEGAPRILPGPTPPHKEEKRSASLFCSHKKTGRAWQRALFVFRCEKPRAPRAYAASSQLRVQSSKWRSRRGSSSQG